MEKNKNFIDIFEIIKEMLFNVNCYVIIDFRD